MQKLAGRGKNGEERCKRHGPLSRLEPARCWNFFTRIGKSQHPGARPRIPIQGLPWSKDDYLPGTYILSTNYYQIELLTNPDACDLTWSKMCSVELTASCGTNEDKHK